MATSSLTTYLRNNFVYLVQTVELSHGPEWGYDTSHLDGKAAKILGCYNTQRQAFRHAAAEVYRLEDEYSEPTSGVSFDDLAIGSGPWRVNVYVGDAGRDVEYTSVEVRQITCKRYFSVEDHPDLFDDEDRGLDAEGDDDEAGERENYAPTREPHIPLGPANCLAGRSFALFGAPDPHRRERFEDHIRFYGGQIVPLFPLRRELQFVIAHAIDDDMREEMARFNITVLSPRRLLCGIERAPPGSVLTRNRWGVYNSVPRMQLGPFPNWMLGAKVVLSAIQEPLSTEQITHAITLCGGKVVSPTGHTSSNVYMIPESTTGAPQLNGIDRWTQTQMFQNFPPGTDQAQYKILEYVGVNARDLSRIATELGLKTPRPVERTFVWPAPFHRPDITAPLPPAFEGARALPWGPDGCLTGLNFAFAGSQEVHNSERFADMIRGYGGRITQITNETHCVITSDPPSNFAMLSEVGILIQSQSQLAERIWHLTLAYPRLDQQLNPSRPMEEISSPSENNDQQPMTTSRSSTIDGIYDQELTATSPLQLPRSEAVAGVAVAADDSTQRPTQFPGTHAIEASVPEATNGVSANSLQLSPSSSETAISASSPA